MKKPNKMTHALAMVACFVIAAVGIVFGFGSDWDGINSSGISSNKHQVPRRPLDGMHTPPSIFLPAPVPGDSLDEKNKNTPQANVAKNSFWQLSSAVQALPHLPSVTTKQSQDGRVFLSYDYNTMQGKKEGDAIEAFIPQLGVSIKGQVDNIERNNESTRWQGTLDDGGSFSITQTTTKNATEKPYAVASFMTQGASYNLEASGGWGWFIDQKSNFYLPKGGDEMHE